MLAVVLRIGKLDFIDSSSSEDKPPELKKEDLSAIHPSC
jgi:hypothetical protein